MRRREANIWDGVKFLLPLLIWLIVTGPFVTGRAMVSIESFYFYSMLKFYLGHLFSGTVPLWQPFVWWGFPLPIILVYIGLTNPFWLLFPLLQVVGIPPYAAHVALFILYFFLGQIGFYCLAKAIFKDKRIAYTAFILLLFSSFSFPLFSMVNALLIYIPAVWYFYFKVRFHQRPEKRFYLGMIFSVMVALSGYLPLYFLTVLLLAGLLAVGLWPAQALTVMTQKREFFRKNWMLVLACFLALFLTALPAVKAFQSTKEVVDPARGMEVTEHAQGFHFDNYARTTDGGLSARMTVQDLFSHLDHIAYGNDGFFFISIFGYIILFLGVFLKACRRFIFFLALSLILLLLTLGNTTPVHKFLYQHVFYFKLLRNMHFFLPFLLSSVILLVCEIFKKLLENKGNILGNKKYSLILIAGLHVAVVVFLLIQGNIVVTSYLTVGLSLLFFVLLPSEKSAVQEFFLPVILFSCLIIQPAQVLWDHNIQAVAKDTSAIREALTTMPGQGFVWVRPLGDTQEQNSLNVYYRHFLSNTDAPTKLLVDHGFPAYATFFLFKKLDPEAFEKYARFKFIVYDSVKVVEEKPLDQLFSEETFVQENAPALIIHSNSDAIKEMVSALPGSSGQMTSRQIIAEPLPEFKVLHFSVNSIKLTTNFKQAKFLVYNDSYDPGWQARVNGHRAEIFRANLAFKGVFLPAGPNEVEFQFAPWGGEWFYLLAIGIPLGTLVGLIFLSLRRSKK